MIYGVSAGFMAVAAPRFLEEYVPPHLYVSISPFFSAAMPFGTFLALLGGLILPPDDSSYEVLSTNETWRILFGFPMLI